MFPDVKIKSATDTGVKATEAGKVFPQTLWTVVLRAKDKSEASLHTLLCSYRQPLLVYLRCKGHAPQDVEDVVNGFIEHLLKRDFLANVRREKGKFRTFLIKSLRNFMRDQRDKETAGIRKPGSEAESLDQKDDEGHVLFEPACQRPSADEEFDRAWANNLLSNALRQLETECARTGHGSLYQALEPVFYGDEDSSSYQEIGKRLEMSEGAVKVAAHRLRVRLRGLIREAIMQTVDNEEDFKSELSYLVSLFARPTG